MMISKRVYGGRREAGGGCNIYPLSLSSLPPILLYLLLLLLLVINFDKFGQDLILMARERDL